MTSDVDLSSTPLDQIDWFTLPFETPLGRVTMESDVFDSGGSATYDLDGDGADEALVTLDVKRDGDFTSLLWIFRVNDGQVAPMAWLEPVSQRAVRHLYSATLSDGALRIVRLTTTADREEDVKRSTCAQHPEEVWRWNGTSLVEEVAVGLAERRGARARGR